MRVLADEWQIAKPQPLASNSHTSMMVNTQRSGTLPDTIKFLLVLGILAGVVYGGVVALATFPPEQSEIIKPLPHEKLRQK